MDERRIAMNEATFRKVNEAIQAGRAQSADTVEVICECGRLGCVEHLRIDADAYNAVRGHRRRFVVVPGHELPEVEQVVDRGDGYLVVEKTGEAGRVAERISREPLPDLGL
jgi:hypothetical protein